MEIGLNPFIESSAFEYDLNVFGDKSRIKETGRGSNWIRAIPIKARAAQDENGILLEINNQSPFKIDHCRLYYSNRFFNIQPIPVKKRTLQRIDHERVTKQIPYHFTGKNHSDIPLRPIRSKDLSMQMAQDLNQNLLQSIHARYRERTDVVHLTGWISGSVKPIMVEPKGLGSEGVTLVEWAIPLEKQETESQARTKAR